MNWEAFIKHVEDSPDDNDAIRAANSQLDDRMPLVYHYRKAVFSPRRNHDDRITVAGGLTKFEIWPDGRYSCEDMSMRFNPWAYMEIMGKWMQQNGGSPR